MTTFGVNGWLAPGSIANLASSGNTERGLAYNPVTKNLVLVSRAGANNIVILNGTTGSVSGTLSNSGLTTSGVTLAVNTAGVSGDGQIYVSNLATNNQPLIVYSWDSESSVAAPTRPFQWTVPANSTLSSGTGSYRYGDAFDVYGTGASIRFAAAGSTTGTTGGLGTSFRNNGNFLIGTSDTTNSFTMFKGMANTGTNTNNYRSSLCFVDADTIIGMEGGAAKLTDFVFSSGTQQGVNATVISSIQQGTAPLGSTAQYKIIDCVSIAGNSYLAALRCGDSSTGNGANIVDVYNITSAMTQLSGTNPTLVASLSTTTGTFVNGNNTGQVAWGEPVLSDPVNSIYTVPLYALNTNNGVQAMVFAVPEPSTTAVVAVSTAGLVALMLRKKRRNA